MSLLLKRYGAGLTSFMILATLAWILGTVLLPNFMMIDLSLKPPLLPSEIGGAKDVYTLENYATLWRNGIHFAVFAKTIWSSAFVALLSIVVCYPIAYYLAQVVKPERAALLILILLIPFWINEILRSFAWYIILAYQGPLNALLIALGLVTRPVRFLMGDGGVMVGMIYAYLLFMIFPLYNAIESLDHNQIEAARDLGAPSWRIHWRVVIPYAKPGIAAGGIMVFILAASSYAVPAILGGPNSRWFTEIIYGWFFDGQNWNQGAAYAFILLLLCVAFISVMMAVFRVRLGDIAK